MVNMLILGQYFLIDLFSKMRASCPGGKGKRFLPPHPPELSAPPKGSTIITPPLKCIINLYIHFEDRFYSTYFKVTFISICRVYVLRLEAYALGNRVHGFTYKILYV